MWSIATKTLRANLSRFVATLVAIAVGVGFLTAGTMITNSIENSLGGEIDRQYEGVDAAVGPRSEDSQPGANTFAVSVLDTVKGADGVADAAGIVIGSTKLPASLTDEGDDDDTDSAGDVFAQGPTVRAWIDNDRLNPIDLVDGTAPGPGEVTVDQGLADKYDIELGQQLELSTGSGAKSYRVV
ncbi:MAG TPA: ABC transporter permease, partial [Microthrixaceae bacterium]|nr:ABC transporter permease [Microthrixaceae bacterium]